MAELFEWSLGGACDLGAFQVLDLLLHWQRHLPRWFPRHAGSHSQDHVLPFVAWLMLFMSFFLCVLRLREVSLRAGRSGLRMLVLLA